MAGTLKHAKTSGKTDGADATKVQPSDWNADHTFAGGVDGQLLARDSAQSDGATWQYPLASPQWAAARPRITKVLDSLASGWTRSSSVGTVAHTAESGAPGNGTILKLTTVDTQNVAAQPAIYSPTLDISTSQLAIWVKLSDPSAITECLLYATSDNFAGFYAWQLDALPNTKSFLIANEWSLITLSLANASLTSGTVNTAAINRFRLRISATAAGYSASFSSISTFPKTATAAVSLTFDDSLATQFSTARPIMNAYGFPATAYNIISLIGDTGYTLAQAQELHRVHGWEMAAHAWSLDYHPPGPNNVAQTDAQLHYNFRRTRRWLIENGFGSGADHFAFPQGAFDRRVLDICRQYFTSARTTTGTTGHTGTGETYPPADPYRLRVLGVDNTTPAATITAAVDRAVAGKHWLILVFHHVVTTPTLITEYSTANFTTVMAYLNTVAVPVRTVGDVLKHGL